MKLLEIYQNKPEIAEPCKSQGFSFSRSKQEGVNKFIHLLLFIFVNNVEELQISNLPLVLVLTWESLLYSPQQSSERRIC